MSIPRNSCSFPTDHAWVEGYHHRQTQLASLVIPGTAVQKAQQSRIQVSPPRRKKAVLLISKFSSIKPEELGILPHPP